MMRIPLKRGMVTFFWVTLFVAAIPLVPVYISMASSARGAARSIAQGWEDRDTNAMFLTFACALLWLFTATLMVWGVRGFRAFLKSDEEIAEKNSGVKFLVVSLYMIHGFTFETFSIVTGLLALW